MKKLHFYSVLCWLCLLINTWNNPKLEAAGWSPISTIGTNVSNTPDVAVDNSGDAVSVFIHFDGTNQRVQSAIRPFGKDWNTLAQFLSPAGQNAETPRVAVSPKGNATAVWKLASGTDFIVQAATLPFNSETWSAPVNLTNSVNLGADPIVGVDTQGNSLAVWSIIDGSFYHIQSATLAHGSSSWVMLNDLIVNQATELDLAIDPAGNAVLVWEGRIGFKNVIQAATLSFGSSTWVQTSDLSPSNLQSRFPIVGVDQAGNAIAVWSQGISFTDIASAKLAFGSTTWVNTSNPSTDPRSFSPDLAVAPTGYAVAIWETIIDNSTTLVEASTLPAGSFTWTAPVTLTHSLVITDPEVVVDIHGNAVGVWSASGILQASLLPFGGSWTAPVNITPPTIGVGENRIAMSPCAFAVVVFTSQVFSSGQEIVQAVNSEGLFPPAPPSNLKGRVIKNIFLTQTEYIHRLTWDASPDSCVTQYFVRRNGQLIGVISSNGPFRFNDHDRNKKKKDVYTVTAVKSDGTESTALTITLP